MFQNENYFKIVAYLLGIGGLLFTIIGGLVTFIFREHIKDNHSQFSKNDHEHERIFDKIELKKDK